MHSVCTHGVFYVVVQLHDIGIEREKKKKCACWKLKFSTAADNPLNVFTAITSPPHRCGGPIVHTLKPVEFNHITYARVAAQSIKQMNN